MSDNIAKMTRSIASLAVTGLLLPLYAVPAEAQSAPYDGVYTGSQTLSEAAPTPNYAQCLKGPFKRHMVVKDSVVTYTFNPTYHGEVTGPVGADGDVSGSAPEPAGGVVLTGKIVGDTFTGEVWSLYCTYAVEMKRLPQ